MPRPTREQNKVIDQMQRGVVTLRPQTVTGGFFPLAALAPFAAALGVPIAASAGKWVGNKIFGTGIMQAGHGRGAGLLRAGERMAPSLKACGAGLRVRGGATNAFRAGDYKMPTMAPVMNHRTGTMTGMQGGFIANLPDSIVPPKIKNAIKMATSVGGKAKTRKTKPKKKA